MVCLLPFATSAPLVWRALLGDLSSSAQDSTSTATILCLGPRRWIRAGFAVCAKPTALSLGPRSLATTLEPTAQAAPRQAMMTPTRVMIITRLLSQLFPRSAGVARPRTRHVARALLSD